MAEHRTLVANLQYPRFTGSPAFAPRADDIAQLAALRRCDSAVFGEAGYNECLRLSGRGGLRGWEYDRAQGKGRGVPGEGLNSVWSDPDVWVRARLSDYDLPSFGQSQRTALGVRLEEKADRSAFAMLWAIHFAAKGAPLSQAGADHALGVQVRYLQGKVGGRRSAWLGDFPRTNSADDVRWLTGQGYRPAYRTTRTPLAVMVQGAVNVLEVEPFAHGRMFDHDYLVATWSVAGKQDA